MIESIDRHIGQMDPGELQALAGELAELQMHPGWLRLQELVELEKGRLKEGTLARVWGHISRGKGVSGVDPSLTHAAGMVIGLERHGEIIANVTKTAAEVRRSLEARE